MPNLTYILLLLMGVSLIFHLAGLLQRRGWSAIGFALLLALNLGLVVVAVMVTDAMPWAFAAFGLFVVVVIAPAILGTLMRLAIRRGDYAQAVWWLGWRCHLQPGLGLHKEREMLTSLALVHQGRGEEAIAVALAELERQDLGDEERLVLVERALTLLLVEEFFEQAKNLFESEGGMSLADRAPGICVSMVRVFGELGDLEQMARCQLLLENSELIADPAMSGIINSARLGFLAHLGRATELEPLLQPESSFMPGATEQRQKLWFGIALDRAGSRPEAEVLWRQVMAAEEQDPQAAETARQRLRREQSLVVDSELAPELMGLVELVVMRAGASSDMPRAEGPLWRAAPATLMLVVGILLVHGVVVALSGSEVEPWVLTNLGANFAPLSLHGEPWRLVASMFLHVDFLHLALNAYALYLLGKFTERLFGSTVFWAIYGLAGVGGSLVSALHAKGALSVGASGAIFGLLGAALVGLRLLRGKVPDKWRRRITLNLLIVIALQVVVGLRFAAIDNAAHFGGLVTGAVVALIFGVPMDGVLARVRRVIATLVGAALLTSVAYAAVSVVANSRGGSTILRVPRQEFHALGVRFFHPAHWKQVPSQQGIVFQDPLSRLSRTFQILPPQHFAASVQLEEAARRANVQIVAGLKQERGVNLVRQEGHDTVKLAPTIVRSELRVEVAGRTVYQLHYFKRVGETLVTMVGRVEGSQRGPYLSLFDALAGGLAIDELKTEL